MRKIGLNVNGYLMTNQSPRTTLIAGFEILVHTFFRCCSKTRPVLAASELALSQKPLSDTIPISYSGLWMCCLLLLY